MRAIGPSQLMRQKICKLMTRVNFRKLLTKSNEEAQYLQAAGPSELSLFLSLPGTQGVGSRPPGWELRLFKLTRRAALHELFSCAQRVLDLLVDWSHFIDDLLLSGTERLPGTSATLVLRCATWSSAGRNFISCQFAKWKFIACGLWLELNIICIAESVRNRFRGVA